jgi:hypothetical protein
MMYCASSFKSVVASAAFVTLVGDISLASAATHPISLLSGAPFRALSLLKAGKSFG